MNFFRSYKDTKLSPPLGAKREWDLLFASIKVKNEDYPSSQQLVWYMPQEKVNVVSDHGMQLANDAAKFHRISKAIPCLDPLVAPVCHSGYTKAERLKELKSILGNTIHTL